MTLGSLLKKECTKVCLIEKSGPAGCKEGSILIIRCIVIVL